jgi:hypothetical protein
MMNETLKMDVEDERSRSVRVSFADQADLCEKFGSGFTAGLLRGVLRVLNGRTRFGARILTWDGDPGATADALALRAAGALHALVRRNPSCDLAGVYPPNPTVDPMVFERILAGAIDENDGFLSSWLDHAPQTNEVGRAALLYAGMMEVAGRTGCPLSVFEIGTSAGLNLILDRYAYVLDGREVGDPSSPLVLHPEWIGTSPRGPGPRIVARRGCDLAPIDVTTTVGRERALAYIWPDQEQRHRRIAQAISLFLDDPAPIERGNAPDWVSSRLRLPGVPGIARVLFHSLTFSYLPSDGQAAIAEHMETIGARATPQSPVAWLSFELDRNAEPHLALRLWPGGGEERLATADPHGRRIIWHLGAD